jgi:hypothetical protein
MPGQINNNKHVSVQAVQNPLPPSFDQDNDIKKFHKGGESSVKQKKTTDPASDRNAGKPKEKIKSLRVTERSFSLLVDDVPYFVNVNPFPYNTETRFYINVNGGDDHVFTWDAQLHRLRSIDDASWLLPDVLEEAISEKLQ